MSRPIDEGRSLWYATDDQEATSRPYLFCPNIKQATELNEKKGMGIFWTVNEVEGVVRQKVNLKRILSWAIEFDDCDKIEQRRRMKKIGLTPSLVIESKSGFQIYFDAIDGTAENWLRIVKAMAKKCEADPNGLNIVRTMRAPFFWHLKDPKDPFAVRVESYSDVMYFEREMLKFFCSDEVKKKPSTQIRQKISISAGDTYSRRLDSIGAEEGLRRLSGTGYVSGQRYEFVNLSSGNKNLLVDGKTTACFINSENKIFGSEAAPTILQWLQHRDYGHSKDRAWEIIFELFPEVFTEVRS